MFLKYQVYTRYVSTSYSIDKYRRQCRTPKLVRNRNVGPAWVSYEERVCSTYVDFIVTALGLVASR